MKLNNSLKTYTILAERKPENIYRDTTETFSVIAANLREAIKAGRRECRWSDTRFVSAKLNRA
jgi:hypothetical protein